MHYRNDVQHFDELATEILEALNGGEGKNFDRLALKPLLVSGCMVRLITLSGMPPDHPHQDSPVTLRHELDQAVMGVAGACKWTESERLDTYRRCIGILEDLLEGSQPSKDELLEVASFARAVAIGIESYKLKIMPTVRSVGRRRRK